MGRDLDGREGGVRRTGSPAGPIGSAAGAADGGGRRLQGCRAALLFAVGLGLAAGLGGCGNESDLSAPAQAPAPAKSLADATVDAGGGGVGATPKTDPLLAALNQRRAAGAQCGAVAMPPAPPLRADAAAEVASDGHTAWMQANRILSHTGMGGSTAATRLADAGYAWSAVGENVASGQSTPEAVLDAWLASPGHCRNLLDPAFADVGFSFVPVTAGAASYATLLLARSR